MVGGEAYMPISSHIANSCQLMPTVTVMFPGKGIFLVFKKPPNSLISALPKKDYLQLFRYLRIGHNMIFNCGNKGHSNKNKHGLFTQSLLYKGNKLTPFVLALTQR